MNIAVDTCKPTPVSVNSTQDTYTALYGTIVKYHCLKGFHFPGYNFDDVITIECDHTLKWNSSIPDCKRM